MLNFTVFLTILLFRLSCDSQDNVQLSKSNETTANSHQISTTTFPEIHCRGELPNSLKTQIGAYRLAKESDFVASIRSYAQEHPSLNLICNIFGADFSQNNLNDYALLLVAEDNTHFRFLLLLNKGQGEFAEVIVKDYQSITKPSDGLVYTSMEYKLPGEPGITQRAYSPIKTDTPEGEKFIAQPAIELWDAIKLNQANVPQDTYLETLAYCSNVYYLVETQFETITVCD
ncbi:MAG: hypothetical protein AAGE84_10540 [Cyanobacteria bacterium P01_G01_bin.39]